MSYSNRNRCLLLIVSNYDFYTSTPSLPLGALGRVGVWNAAGINPTALLESMAEFCVTNSPESEIEILLQKGQNPNQAGPIFNNGPIKCENLTSIICRGRNDLVLRNSEVKVAEGTTILKMIIDGVRYTETETANLTAEVCTNAHLPAGLMNLTGLLGSRFRRDSVCARCFDFCTYHLSDSKASL